MEQQVKVSPHDRMIQTARIAADREIKLDWMSKHQDVIATLEEDQPISMVDGLVLTLHSGTINFEFTGLSAEIHSALVDERAMALLFQQRANAGQAILKLMWEFHLKQKVTYRGEEGTEYNPDDLVLYVNKTFGSLMDDNEYYADQLALVVLRVLQPVHAAEEAGKPYTDEDGNPITVSSLVDGRKMLGKLIGMSATFEKTDEEGKSSLLNAAATGTQADVKAARNTINGVGPITGVWTVHTSEDGLYDVDMKGLTTEQVQYIEKALGKGWQQELR